MFAILLNLVKWHLFIPEMRGRMFSLGREETAQGDLTHVYEF